MTHKVQNEPSPWRGFLPKTGLLLCLLAVLGGAHHEAMYCNPSGAPIQFMPNAYSIRDVISS